MKRITVLLLCLLLSGCVSPSVPTAIPSPPATPTRQVQDIPGLFSLISRERLFTTLEDLTSLQVYSGWRNSATEGEAQALEYIAGRLEGFARLQELGMELERQDFHVFLATEVWESRLFLTNAGKEIEVPVNALSGHRRNISQALRFDSDGELNDTNRDPVEVTGQVLLLRTYGEVMNLPQADAENRIILLDFAVVDPQKKEPEVSTQIVRALIQKKVAALVLVVSKGIGRYATDGTFLEDSTVIQAIPMLNLILEDLAPAGIASWEDLSGIESARLVWDTDVSSPGESGNLVARIPGADSSRAVILGAHIDSTNSPGAGDNALNCAVLLEVARVLDESAFLPPVDVYLVWFGSEELGFYGSQHFVSTHQELLDRTVAAFLMDGYTADLTGPTTFGMQEASYVLFGDSSIPLADYLSQQASLHGIPLEFSIDSDHISSDDGSFYGFVPAVRFAFGNRAIGLKFHSPYDTLESVQDQGEAMEQSVKMALIAALETPLLEGGFRVTPAPERRALIIATHTEELFMTPTMLIHLDRALTWEGFDVDVLPYGRSPTPADLADADLVVVLPVIDHPSIVGDVSLYDEQWQADEIRLLVNYVEQGGFLVLTNSASHQMRGGAVEANEDWEDANVLAAPFGISFAGEPFLTIRASVTGTHPLVGDLVDLVLLARNGLPIIMQAGVVLAEAQGKTAIGLVDYGSAGGQVLVLSDLGLLDLYSPNEGERNNLEFLRLLAQYARGR